MPEKRRPRRGIVAEVIADANAQGQRGFGEGPRAVKACVIAKVLQRAASYLCNPWPGVVAKRLGVLQADAHPPIDDRQPGFGQGRASQKIRLIEKRQGVGEVVHAGVVVAIDWTDKQGHRQD